MFLYNNLAQMFLYNNLAQIVLYIMANAQMGLYNG